MTGNRNGRDRLRLSDDDLEDLGLRLELAITRAVQPEAPALGSPRDVEGSAEPAWSSVGRALDPDAVPAP